MPARCDAQIVRPPVRNRGAGKTQSGQETIHEQSHAKLAASPLIWCTALPLALSLISNLGCSSNQPTTIRLIDQIPEEQPAGPWRVVAALEPASALQKDPARFGLIDCSFSGDSLVQEEEVSVFEFDGEIRAAENAFFDLEYDRAFGVGASVMVRLLGPHVSRERTETLGRRRIMMRLAAPESGAARIHIEHHVPKGTVIPLKSVSVLSMDNGVAAHVMIRARYLLRFSQPGFSRIEALRYSRFPISLEGCTRDGVVLLAGDTLTFNQNRISGKRRLCFWTALCQGAARLRVERRIGREWAIVASWGPTEMGSASWQRTEVPDPDVLGWESLRFILSGETGDEAVILAEPHLLPRNDLKSHKRNLIIVDLDTMRADRLGCYGYQARPTSARLDSVLHATGFFAFQNAFSSAPWTQPATARFLTGRYLESNTTQAIPRGYETLAEVLVRNGYYCIAYTGGGQLRGRGFEQGFHEYYWTRNLGKVEDTFPEAISWLNEERLEPFFLFLHTYEPHEPYIRNVFCRGLPRGRLADVSKGQSLRVENMGKNPELSREERLYVEAAYDGGIRTACDAAADLLVALEASQLLENTIVVILSDHGEEFWDHSVVYADHPMTSLYGELLHVPFMIHVPDQSRRSGIHWIDQEVSTVDLVPTVLELLGLASPLGCHGVSLVPTFSSLQVDREVPLLGISWHTNREWVSKACVISEGRKYIRPVSRWRTNLDSLERDDRYPCEEELFFLAEDPRETVNVAEAYPPIAKSMATLLTGGLLTVLETEYPVDPGGETPAIPEDLAHQLNALGYVDNQ